MKLGISLALGLIAGLLIGMFVYLSRPAAPAAPASDPLERELRYQVSGLPETGSTVQIRVLINGQAQTVNKLPFEVIEKGRAGDSVMLLATNSSPAATVLGYLGCKILSNGIEVAFDLSPNAEEDVVCTGTVR